MSRSWDHQVYRLDEPRVDFNDRFGRTCATGQCVDLATHLIRWQYVTGRAGRVSSTGREVCTGHAEKFAAKHQLTIGDPRRAPASTVAAVFAAITGGQVHRVRVYNPRGSGWYLEERRSGGGLFATSNRWLAGVRADASLDEAVAEAEVLLARTSRLVPAGEWQRGDQDAAVEVIPAQRADGWFDRSWELTVASGADGIWTLTRVLAERFAPIVTSLGDHNMSLDRALRVATDMLAAEGWVPCQEWSTYDNDTASQDGWHPDQADPGRWRQAEEG